MAHVIVRHKVQDYSTWKSAFDDFVDARRTGGEKSYQIFHMDDDPNNVMALVEYDNLDNARNFFASSELREAMGKAGVTEPPEIYFLEGCAQGNT